MDKEVKVSNQTNIGYLFWLAGWAFTLGYFKSHSILGDISAGAYIAFSLMLLPSWPYFLGTVVGLP